jgi:hypothetical protein
LNLSAYVRAWIYKTYFQRQAHQAELMRARTRTDLASHAQRTQQTINPDVRGAIVGKYVNVKTYNPREQCSHAREFHCRAARPGPYSAPPPPQ